MTPRLNPFAAAPAPMKSWRDYGLSVLETGLEESLMDLVEIRASQINGCALCLDICTRPGRASGERRSSVST
jgi:AhpD family alkylhydroperoxidase